ncbi:MAG: type 2 isopentenyl-diphosphate Delta-isomerase, partial [Anaerolineales bacterium]
MPKVTPTSSRKADHILINLNEDVRSAIQTGLERYRFIHQALPELNLESINLTQKIFGRTIQSPIMISSMTGGSDQAVPINRTLAMA